MPRRRCSARYLRPDGVPADRPPGRRRPGGAGRVASARAAARARAWELAGEHAPDHHAGAASLLVIDVDATPVTAHSGRTGEPLAFGLRAGNACSNTVVDHIAVLRASLAQLSGHAHGRRPGKNVLIRIDGAGGTHELLGWLTRRRLSYSVGFSLPRHLALIQKRLASIPDDAWTSAYDADRQVRPGAFVAEVTGLFDLSS